ncbi:MAG: Fe-S cluster assembly protein SufD [Alphaproteobacteria bacterium]|nr:Fe-S cluster assembly protein SufD [Alphaproteobacteria bacterium]
MTTAPLIRLGPAEHKLISQLRAAGAADEAERLAGAGLPTRRVEDYHYTDLKALLRDVPDMSAAAETASPPAFAVPGAYRLEMANGVVQQAGTAPAGVMAGTVAGGVLSARDDVLVRLNSGLVGMALRLDLDNEVMPVIHIDRRIEGAACHVADAVKIFVGDGGKAVVVESFSGSDSAHLGNHATYVALGRDAELTHILVDLSGKAVRHFASVEYRLAEDSRLTSLVVNSGSALSRTQIFASVTGAGAHGDFRGLSLVEDGQHCDVTLQLVHEVAYTTSKETYKTVGRGRSRGVFQGKIVVKPDAQKTDAKMMANGLMLSDETEILAKPELEIFADDVVCGHGSTCGALDSESLFYLMSRGIPRAEAQAMLVRAFLEASFEDIATGELREALSAVAETWLTRGLA